MVCHFFHRFVGIKDTQTITKPLSQTSSNSRNVALAINDNVKQLVECQTNDQNLGYTLSIINIAFNKTFQFLSFPFSQSFLLPLELMIKQGIVIHPHLLMTEKMQTSFTYIFTLRNNASDVKQILETTHTKQKL